LLDSLLQERVYELKEKNDRVIYLHTSQVPQAAIYKYFNSQ